MILHKRRLWCLWQISCLHHDNNYQNRKHHGVIVIAATDKNFNCLKMMIEAKRRQTHDQKGGQPSQSLIYNRVTIDTIAMTDFAFLIFCQNLSCRLICRFLLLYIQVYLKIDVCIVYIAYIHNLSIHSIHSQSISYSPKNGNKIIYSFKMATFDVGLNKWSQHGIGNIPN